jgi:hypothetical protein
VPATRRTFALSVLPKFFAVCKLAAGSAVPEWATRGEFFSITSTNEELSIIAEKELIPEDLREEASAKAAWRVLKVHGPFEWSAVGVLAALVSPLAEAGVSVFTISTFDTDYLLVRREQLQAAEAALRRAGHKIHELETVT